ncbi:MAG: c-type cytochrome [Bacteroidales bacterium]|nr:c-type cytochrome [Bacteroidales bacterium]
MKKINILSFIAVFFISSITFIACSNGNGNDKHEHNHNATEESSDHDHTAHSHDEGGGHMKHMNDVKAKLQKELGDKYNAPVPEATPEQITLGKEIYSKNCVSCHGEQGKGDGPASKGLPTPPANFTDAAHATFYSEEGRKQIIRKGVEGTVMVAWENILSEDEIDAVYAFIKTFINKNQNGETSDDGHNHQH